MDGDAPQLVQVRFADPDGSHEVLWVEAIGHESYTVMNVPVCLHGASLGSIVRCLAADGEVPTFSSVLRNSPGGTVRVILPPGTLASEWYLNYLLPNAVERYLSVGPATFFDPRMVAVHVQQRNDLWEDVGSYLTDLVEQAVIQEWEAGDPETDQDPVIVDRTLRGDDIASTEAKGTVLVHDIPNPGRRGIWTDTE